MNMRMIMVALPCLLFCGFVSAREAPSLDVRTGADSQLMATAFDAIHAEHPLVGKTGAMEAAKKKSAKTAAKAAPAPAPAAQPTDTSKRFNMTQNGKRMTADDFDAWMKKNGYRVATGAPAAGKEEPQKGAKK
ncbi:hypothetical protein [Lysobacter sp. Root494]|uniref:hypothetical protein n=1 Tax=Lysobacter sp. Root494 TaxID=1736549 RepID=UPI0007000E97|nr:hypothetical protein [Lysobacter sp. Root494]KQY51715.1 hypothetical protein ASD14_03215 [Lysobacter sp. Root494]